MCLFSKQSYFFEDPRFKDKTVKKCLSLTLQIKKIVSNTNIKVLLCTPAKSAGSFIFCSEDTMYYAHKKGLIFTIDVYPFVSITGITAQTRGLALQYVVINLAGAQTIITDVYADVDDFAAFVNAIDKLKDKDKGKDKENKEKEENKAPTAGSLSSTADELLKFKQLWDMGAITQDEYEIIKKRILDE